MSAVANTIVNHPNMSDIFHTRECCLGCVGICENVDIDGGQAGNISVCVFWWDCCVFPQKRSIRHRSSRFCMYICIYIYSRRVNTIICYLNDITCVLECASERYWLVIWLINEFYLRLLFICAWWDDVSSWYDAWMRVVGFTNGQIWKNFGVTPNKIFQKYSSHIRIDDLNIILWTIFDYFKFKDKGDINQSQKFTCSAYSQSSQMLMMYTNEIQHISVYVI